MPNYTPFGKSIFGNTERDSNGFCHIAHGPFGKSDCPDAIDACEIGVSYPVSDEDKHSIANYGWHITCPTCLKELRLEDEEKRIDLSKMDLSKMVILGNTDGNFSIITEERYMHTDCAPKIIDVKTYRELLTTTLYNYITSPVFKHCIKDHTKRQHLQEILIALIVEFKEVFEYEYTTRLPFVMDKIYLDYIIHIHRDLDSFVKMIDREHTRQTKENN